MTETPAPRRRWFQFRLSTWFVLLGILCWALTSVDFTSGLNRHHRTVWWINEFKMDELGHCIEIFWGNARGWWWIFILLNRLVVPTLALLAFLTWKATWLVVEQRRARAAA
jgi:hypothetical protein